MINKNEFVADFRAIGHVSHDKTMVLTMIGILSVMFLLVDNRKVTATKARGFIMHPNFLVSTENITRLMLNYVLYVETTKINLLSCTMLDSAAFWFNLLKTIALLAIKWIIIKVSELEIRERMMICM